MGDAVTFSPLFVDIKFCETVKLIDSYYKNICRVYTSWQTALSVVSWYLSHAPVFWYLSHAPLSGWLALCNLKISPSLTN